MDRLTLEWAKTVADDEMDHWREIGLAHPEGCIERDRCMARARVAWRISQKIQNKISPNMMDMFRQVELSEITKEGKK